MPLALVQSRPGAGPCSRVVGADAQGDAGGAGAAAELWVALRPGTTAPRLGRAADGGDAQLPLRGRALPRFACTHGPVLTCQCQARFLAPC